jgi:gluconate 2-dehydrogenase gamma chain
MGEFDFTRRNFLLESLAGAGTAWLVAAWPEVLAAGEHARHAMEAAASGALPKFEFLTPAQAADVEAISSLIIPTTETPGAREAGVVYFADRYLNVYAPERQKPFTDALALVDAKCKELFPTSSDFASLPATLQAEILKAIERTPAFNLFRGFAVVGFLCNPEDGGNRDMVGWKLVGFEAAHTHTPPFGYYDAEYIAEKNATAKTGKK